MSDDYLALRKEIKAWEHNFKATHGRDPSVNDIKKEPGLADKYKRYKKAPKPAETKRPSTPPRPSTHLLTKPRPAATTQPLSGYNPFSPQKNKGKQKELSPEKPKPFRLPSPNAPDPFLATPDDPISRARKRLRGEPVSPSPNKEKRRRITQDSDDDGDENADASFMEDSPVKAPTGFKLLFDEVAAPRAKLLFPTTSKSLFRAEKMDVDDDANNPFLDAPSDDEMPDAPPPKPKEPSPPRDLLAPSPPPTTSQRVPAAKSRGPSGKGKGKAKADKAPSDGEDSTGSDDEMNVRLFDRHASRGHLDAEGDLDEEAYHLRSRRRDIDANQPETTSEPSIAVAVPDSLLNVLSIAPANSTAVRGRRDEEVVGELLYGERRGNYDPSKGGEIWGVGEYEGQERERDEFSTRAGPSYDDEEEDWEGEGVPWEVGEL
ncbi:hypothetical protein FB45DRAFT_559647 [Roridomyces roridus]|uniref:DNA replication regulator SLD2 n=1 Tax=Roridomyces roridus TaxID=1738132 RepID=A0AAD7BWA6_9AGAR|nr:hypothetical protein FB45DRAFT_559647 [Roridomyces roridus]